MNHRLSDRRSVGFAGMILCEPVDAGIARALNVQIRRLAEMLPGGLEHLYGFSCECGCGETLQLSAVEFDHHGGARLYGHDDGQAASRGSYRLAR
jgi:hypothetical protein